MRIILRTSVPGLGKLGDTVTVRGGFARNFLIPQKKAVTFTPENLKAFEVQKAELELAEMTKLQNAQKRAETLSGIVLRLQSPANSEGKLFGSVSIPEIVHLLEKEGYSVEKNEVRIETTIRSVGNYTIHLQLHHEVKISLPLQVEAL